MALGHAIFLSSLAVCLLVSVVETNDLMIDVGSNLTSNSEVVYLNSQNFHRILVQGGTRSYEEGADDHDSGVGLGGG